MQKQYSHSYRGEGSVTRRQQKHDLLVTFMANAQNTKQKQRSAPVKPKFLKTLLSLFM